MKRNEKLAKMYENNFNNIVKNVRNNMPYVSEYLKNFEYKQYVC